MELETPQTCLPNFAGGQLVDAESYAGPVRRGYRWQLHAGPPVPPDEIARAGASARSLQAVAITMVPNEPGRSGVRSFCGDTSGQLCFVVEGLLRVEAGRCLECRPVQ